MNKVKRPERSCRDHRRLSGSRRAASSSLGDRSAARVQLCRCRVAATVDDVKFPGRCRIQR